MIMISDSNYSENGMWYFNSLRCLRHESPAVLICPDERKSLVRTKNMLLQLALITFSLVDSSIHGIVRTKPAAIVNPMWSAKRHHRVWLSILSACCSGNAGQDLGRKEI